MKLGELSEGLIKITDQDLKPLWTFIDSSYKLSFNIEGQNITDETLLSISELYETGRCGFVKLKFAHNDKISQAGAVKLASALKDNYNIYELSLGGEKLGKHGAKYIIYYVVVLPNL